MQPGTFREDTYTINIEINKNNKPTYKMNKIPEIEIQEEAHNEIYNQLQKITAINAFRQRLQYVNAMNDHITIITFLIQVFHKKSKRNMDSLMYTHLFTVTGFKGLTDSDGRVVTL
jgi:hypothetical protein